MCDGDSGGGYVYNHHGQYYFEGIVSVGVGSKVEGGETRCDNFKYSLYTKVNEHMEFIRRVIALVDYNIQRQSCINVHSK